MDSINKMYSIFKSINKKLLEENKNSFIDKYIFEVTSYFISIVHEKVISKNITYTTIYMYKSLIEVITIIYSYMGKEKEFEKLNNLLDSYNSKIEEDIYNKYKNIIDKDLFRFKNIKSKDFDINIAKNKLSYLFENDFANYISNNLNKLLDYYNLINNYIGLSDINSSYDVLISNDFSNKLNIIDSIILTLSYAIVLKYYPDIKPLEKNSLDHEKSYIINHPDVTTYMNYVYKQKEILFDAGEMTNNKLFNVIALTIINLSVDKIYGFTETLDTKLKSIIDISTYYYYKSNDVTNIKKFIDDLYNNEYNAYLRLLYEESNRLNNINGYLIKSYIDINYEYTKIIKILDDIATKVLNNENKKFNNLDDLINKFIKISDKKNEFDLNNINL